MVKKKDYERMQKEETLKGGEIEGAWEGFLVCFRINWLVGYDWLLHTMKHAVSKGKASIGFTSGPYDATYIHAEVR